MKKKPLSLLISVLCCTTISQAQDNKPTDSTELETVEVVIDKDNLFGRTEGYSATRTVAADRINRALNETAQSVSVVTRQQIEDQQPESISDALKYSAGAVTDLVGPARRYDYIALRGFTDNATENTMIDGLKLASNVNSFAQMQYDPYFIERIDMIKGSVSADYGRAVPGGVVSATTKTPLHDQPFHELSFSIGSDNYRQFGFDSTSTLDAEGTIAYRLTGTAKMSDSMQDGQESKRYAIAPSLSWDIAPETNLLLQAYLQKDPEGGFHSGLPAYGTIFDYTKIPGDTNGFKFSRNFSDADPTDKFEREQRIVGYQLTHMFSDDVTFQSKFRYADTDIDNIQTYHLGWNYANPALGISALPDGMLARAAFKTVEESSSFVLDNNIQVNFETGVADHTLVAGVDFQHVKTDVAVNFGIADTFTDVRNPVYGNGNYTFLQERDNKQSMTQLGVYLNDSIQVDNWHFKVGTRFDKVETKLTDRAERIPSLGYAVTPDDATWDGNKVSGNISALYAFDSGISPYVSYSTGFNPNVFESDKGELLKPTTSKQVEVGIKYQPEGTRDLYSLAVYDIEQENTANRVITGNYYTPSGTRTSKGLEFEARTYVTDDLFLQGAVNVSRPKIKDNKGPEAVLNGNVPSQAPKWNASLWANYRFNEAFDASLGIRHVGKQWADSMNTLEVPNYTVVDLGARWRLGGSFANLKGAEVGIAVNNLFDKTYVTGCYNDVNYCYYGGERSIKATFKYQF